jgi:hypothetical protein
MRAFLLLLFTLLAGPAAAQDSVSLVNCKEAQVDCRDECTVEYGGSTRTYDKFGACLQKCKQKYDKCRENQFKAAQERDKLKSAPETSPAASPSGMEGTAAQADGGSQASDGGRSPDGGVPATSAPEMDTTELDQLFDEQQVPPPPQSKTKTRTDGGSSAK